MKPNRSIEELLRIVLSSDEQPAVIGQFPVIAGSPDPAIAALQVADQARHPSYFLSTQGRDRRQEIFESISRPEFDQLREAGIPVEDPGPDERAR